MYLWKNQILWNKNMDQNNRSKNHVKNNDIIFIYFKSKKNG